MAFDKLGFQRTDVTASVGSGKGSVKALCTYWHPTDDVATVETGGYFNAHAAYLEKGDQILCCLNVNNVPVGKDYVVTGNTGTVVTIAPKL